MVVSPTATVVGGYSRIEPNTLMLLEASRTIAGGLVWFIEYVVMGPRW